MSIFDKKTQRAWAKAINRIEVDGKNRLNNSSVTSQKRKAKTKNQKLSKGANMPLFWRNKA